MREPLVITIPVCPSAALSPNSRLGWRAKVRPKQELAHSAYYATIDALNAENHQPVFDPDAVYELKTTIAWGRGRKVSDADNALAMLKAAYDQIAAVLRVNDKQFRHLPIEQVRDTAGVGYVVVEVTG